jgi:hypothetical protein
MRPITLSTLLLLLGAFTTTNATAEVYKHTNPDGSVTFSDVPAKINAKPIELPPSSTYSPPPIRNSESSFEPAKIAVNYESISITSPANDSAVRDNAGNLTIEFNVKPSLKSGHSYVLIMDGKNVGEGQTGSIQIKNVDRGSHTFTVQVVDGDKKMIIQSSAVVVHLQRARVP